MYYIQKICCICLTGNKMMLQVSNIHSIITNFYINHILKKSDKPHILSEMYLCVGCLKTLKSYYKFVHQCIRSKNMFDSYMTELTSFNENLGLFNITVNITDIDPFKEVQGTIKTKPNIAFDDNDLKLSDIVECSVQNDDKVEEISEESNSENSYTFESICVKQEEIVIEDHCGIEDDDSIEYVETRDEDEESEAKYRSEMYDENVKTYDGNITIINHNVTTIDDNAASFDDNTEIYDDNIATFEDNSRAFDDNAESYSYDLNRLQTTTEPIRVIAPKIDAPGPKKTKKKPIFRLSPLSQQMSSCNICSKKFQNRSHLVTHMLTHSDARPFACDICSKRFRQRAHLRTHKMIHFDIKPYQCQLCNKNFRQKAHLNAHILLHSDSKLFRCDICEKFYRSQANLRFHRSSQHRILLDNAINIS